MADETAVATATPETAVATAEAEAPAIHKCRREKTSGQITERTRGRPSDEYEYGYTLNGDFHVGEPPEAPKGKRGRPKGSGTKVAKAPKAKVAKTPKAKTAKVKVAKAPVAGLSKKYVRKLAKITKMSAALNAEIESLAALKS